MEEGQRRFTMGPCLGRGGFGEVYRAIMTAPSGLESEVAIKILRSDLGNEDDAILRLRDEGRLLAWLNHPTILRVVDLVRLDGRFALVTEFVDGADLSECWLLPAPLPLRGTLEVLSAVGDALFAAHTRSGPNGVPLALVHRDVKPSNIRIGRHGEVKLLDFGIARTDTMDREAKTDTSLIVGSLPYMAPERLFDRSPGPESDVFALGCSLFEAIAGERLFESASMRALAGRAMDQGHYEEFIASRMKKIHAPRRVIQALERLVAFEAEERPFGPPLAELLDNAAAGLLGDGLRTWCRTHAWAGAEASRQRGSFESRVLTEERFTATPVPIRHKAPVVYERPVITLSTSHGTPPPVTGRTRSVAFTPLFVALAALLSFGAISAGTAAVAWFVWLGKSADPPANAVPAAEAVPEIEAPPAEVVEPPSAPKTERTRRAAASLSKVSPAAIEKPTPVPMPAVLPEEAPVPPTGTGHVTVRATFPVELRRGEARFSLPADLPEGVYQLYADTGSGFVPRANLSVAAGTTLRLACVADPFSCQEETR